MTDHLPPTQAVAYDYKKQGFYGKLGRGANAEIRFVQSALEHDELDRITLIENIPGSETWDVRDLFQRDVDKSRVTRELLPYLQDDGKVKYFNPLTLALLPLDQTRSGIRRELPVAKESEVEESGHRYRVYEMEGFFRFKVHAENAAFSLVEWNNRNVRVVAIDGQHRLSALKRWKQSGTGEELKEWTIPVVFLGIFRASDDSDVAGLLEIVRKTFVYINTQAETVSLSRQILLNDESVNDVCVQELVQASHANDVRPLSKRDETAVPLLFFDWRGDTSSRGDSLAQPAAIVKSEEIKNWLESYLLGSDGDVEQAAALNLDDLVPPIASLGHGKKLTHEDTKRIRDRFLETVYPGIELILKSFEPYRDYIKRLRQLEADALKQSDTAEHAFTKLRFGTHRAGDEMIQVVEAEYERLLIDLEDMKKGFPEQLTRDVGPRGVMAAFGMLKPIYDDVLEKTSKWEEYARWFVASLNEIYADGWFKSHSDLAAKKRRLLTHLTFDPSGSIVNYKVEDVKNGFGTLLALLVATCEGAPESLLEEAWDRLGDNFVKPLRSGFAKEVRAEIRDEFTGTQKEFRQAVKLEAERRTNARMKKLAKFLNVDVE